MHSHDLSRWQQSHDFSHGHERESEKRVTWVTYLAVAMMLVEIIGGWWLGSVALIADGWHMSTHAMALGTGAFAYAYARRHADNPAYSFGTGKVHALGGFSSAVLLIVVALYVAGESASRFVHVPAVAYSEALAVAALGLIVNLTSAFVLHGSASGHAHDHHEHSHDHAHDHGHAHDTNLRAAYAHLLADTLLSALVIVGLLAGKYLGWEWADPVVGLIGAGIIGQWAWSLLQKTAPVLLDRQAEDTMTNAIRSALEEGGADIIDLHVWHVAPGRLALIVSLLTHSQADSDYYKAKLAPFNLAHITVEVNRCVY